MEDTDWGKFIKGKCSEAEEHSRQGARERDILRQYSEGDMSSFPTESLACTEVYPLIPSIVGDVKPSIIRTLVGYGDVGSYTNRDAENAVQAEYASQYVKDLMKSHNDTQGAFHSAIFDGFYLNYGILTFSVFEVIDNQTFAYEDVPENDIAHLTGKWLKREDVDDGQGGVLVTGEYQEQENKYEIAIECVPPNEFIIDPRARSIPEASLVGRVRYITRSDLISRGYEARTVNGLKEAEARDSEDGTEIEDWEATIKKSEQLVRVYECFVLCDMDSDGVSKGYNVVIAADMPEDSEEAEQTCILSLEPAESANYYELCANPVAHKFGGQGLGEMLKPAQETTTRLWRQASDNLRSQIDPRPVISEAALTPAGVEALNHPAKHMPIMLNDGARPVDAIQWVSVPYIVPQILENIGIWEEKARAMAGISASSGGLSIEDISNVSATAAQIASDASVARADMFIRELARGIQSLFMDLLPVIREFGEVKTLFINGEWRKVDPTTFGDNYDFEVNIGLGAGDRRGDIAALQSIYAMQKEIMMVGGVDNGTVLPSQIYETMVQIVKAAGLPSADPYMTKPDDEAIAAKAAQQNPDPQMELKKFEVEGKIAVEQAQADQAIREEQAKAQIQAQEARQRALLDGVKIGAITQDEYRDALGLSPLVAMPHATPQLGGVYGQ